jgi:DNA-nicking Smr family endonuclease
MPSLQDDGSRVTLDLHGATVDEAIDLTFATLRLAEDRGRQQLKLIHGSSTTAPGRRTIKSALRDLVADGSLAGRATDVLRSRDYVVLALDVTASQDPTRIQLQDVRN